MLLAGGWVLFARLSGLEESAFFRHITGTKGIRIAHIIFGLAVLPVGLGTLALFAFLVWGPDTWIAATSKLAGTPPGARFALTAFFITWVVAASALLIATNGASTQLG